MRRGARFVGAALAIAAAFLIGCQDKGTSPEESWQFWPEQNEGLAMDMRRTDVDGRIDPDSLLAHPRLAVQRFLWAYARDGMARVDTSMVGSIRLRTWDAWEWEASVPQLWHGVPVSAGLMVLSIDKSSGLVRSGLSGWKRIPADFDPTPRISRETALWAALETWPFDTAGVRIGEPELRVHPLEEGTGVASARLEWRVCISGRGAPNPPPTEECCSRAFTYDAHTGVLISYLCNELPLTGSGLVFRPDPRTSEGDVSHSWDDGTTITPSAYKTVALLGLDPPDGNRGSEAARRCRHRQDNPPRPSGTLRPLPRITRKSLYLGAVRRGLKHG